MEFRKTDIEGLIEIFPKILSDERGFFFESYSRRIFQENGITEDFVQDNQSFSRKGVLRGLHFQRQPFAQGKLVRVISGKVMDVVVDIRPESATFGKVSTFILDAERQNMVYVPGSFAHGFITLEEAVFHYKCTNFYDKASEGGIIWNDPDLAVDWGVDNPVVSAKDQLLPAFRELNPEQK
jgi:dTDP-4-dehydrorhamnose 3,5-epimerase